MSRLVFPDEGSRLVYVAAPGGALVGVANALAAQVFTDAAGTVSANLLPHASYPSSVVGSTVLCDAFSRLPLFYGPVDVDTLYVKVSSGPVTPVYARFNDRIDALGSAASHPTSDFDAAGSAAAVAATVTTETTRATTAEALSATKAANLSDLASAATARTNLGLGTAATTAAGAYEVAGVGVAARQRLLLGYSPTAPAGALDATSLAAFNTLAAPRTLDIGMWFNAFPGTPLFTADYTFLAGAGAGVIPMVAWEPTAALNSYTGGGSDAAIISAAAGFLAYGKPVLVRLAHEFNGNWNPYGSTKETAAQFVAGWQYVVNLVRAQGAHNVLWVWNPNVYGAATTVNPTVADGSGVNWYPGDSYVDFLGLDGYMTTEETSVKQFSDLFIGTGSYAAVTSVSTKPFIVCETGVAADARLVASGGKANWYNKAFDTIRDLMPRCVAVVVWDRLQAPDDYTYNSSGTDAAAQTLLVQRFNSYPMVPVAATKSTSGLLAANNLSDVANAATARTNLGLGTAAVAALDLTATDIVALGAQAAGATGKAADAGHVHPTTGVVTAVTVAAVTEAALVAAFAAVSSGGTVWVPDGTYVVTGSPTISTNDVTVMFSGNAWINPTAGVGLTVTGQRVKLVSPRINFNGGTPTTGILVSSGTSVRCTILDPVVWQFGNMSGTYDGIVVDNNAYWCQVIRPRFRKDSGAFTGSFRRLVSFTNVSNAGVVEGGDFAHGTTGVYINNSNSTLVHGCAFESTTDGVEIAGTTGGPGTRVTDIRCESGTNCINITTAYNTNNEPLFFAGISRVSSVTNIVSNPNNIPYTLLIGSRFTLTGGGYGDAFGASITLNTYTSQTEHPFSLIHTLGGAETFYVDPHGSVILPPSSNGAWPAPGVTAGVYRHYNGITWLGSINPATQSGTVRLAVGDGAGGASGIADVLLGAVRPTTDAVTDLGANTVNRWRNAFLSGYLKLSGAATGSLPSASTAGEGVINYDTTLHKIVVSNGTNWVTADKPTAVTKTVGYTLLIADVGNVIISNGVTLAHVLPSAVTFGSGLLTIKNIAATACTVTSTAGTIDAGASVSIAQYASLSFISDGTNWWVM